MKIFSPGLSWYIEKLREEEKFSFVRYGNGEWDCILGLYSKTRSGSQQFSTGLRNALITSITSRRAGNYYLALQSAGFLRRIGLLPRITSWLQMQGPKYKWHDGEVLPKASYKGRLYPLVQEFKKHRTIVVGPNWLISLPFSNIFIPVRSKNCWQDVDSIYQKLIGFRDTVILFSAGPTTKVLIHRLYPLIGDSCWLIDFGSVWDPYCGVKSRRYHSRIDKALIRRNLYGK